MVPVNKSDDENQIGELILRLLVRPDDEQFVNVLLKFGQGKQLTKFHKLLFSQQIEVQQNLDKKQDLIEQLKQDWTVEPDDDDERTTIESEITYQFLYSTHAIYGKQIVNLPFSQKLDLWSIFLEQNLSANQLCLQLFTTFLLHFDVTSSRITPLFQSKFDELTEQTSRAFSETIDLSLLSNSFNLVRWLELIYNWGQLVFIHEIYSKDKASRLIAESTAAEFDANGVYDLRLHTYKDAHFWKQFLSESLNKEEKKFEVTELTIKLIIQNLIFVNSSAIKSERVDRRLDAFNQETTNVILESIHKYPNLVFYLNVEQFYELFTDEHLESMLSSIIKRYIECKEAKYLTFISQNYFLCSRRVQVRLLRVFISLLHDLCVENSVQNLGFLNLLKSIKKKQWPLHLYSTCVSKNVANNQLWEDLSKLAPKLNNLTPVNGFQDKRVHNLFVVLEQWLTLDSCLISGIQCLALITLIGFQSSYILNTQLSVLNLNCLSKLVETPLPARLFDVYEPSSFIKKLFIILAPFNVNSISRLINAIVAKILFKSTIYQNSEHIEKIFGFFAKLDARQPKPNYVEELEFVLRTNLLIELNKSFESRKKQHKIATKFLNTDEIRLRLANNIEECIKQLDRRLNDDTYSKVFKVSCIQGVFQFFNVKTGDPMNEINFEKYFELSIQLTFECIYEQLTDCSSYDRNILFNYLTFLFKNEAIYAGRLTKLELIQQVWTRLVFKPLDLDLTDSDRPANVSAIDLPDFEMFSKQLEDGNLKRKLNADQTGVKRLKKDDRNKSLTIDLDTLVELTKITLEHCSSAQMKQFLNRLLADLQTFNSNFLSDCLDFDELKKKVNLFILIKIVVQNVKNIDVHNEKDKLELFKDDFIQHLIVQVVSFAQNIYNLKIEIQTDLENEETKDDEQIKIAVDRIEALKDKLNQIYEIQVLVLELVESVFKHFRPLGNFTSQQVNYLSQVCVLSDLKNYQQNDPKHFATIFNGIYMILNRILIDYQHTVTSAFSAYMNLVISLLQNLCRIGYQIRFLNLKSETRFEIEKCSINCQHLLLLLSRTKDYTHCTTNVISAFINELQTDIVYSTIKNRILIGIYKLLNSSQSENRLQFIYSRLNPEGRQMFKQIYDNYDKFYRYKGYA